MKKISVIKKDYCANNLPKNSNIWDKIAPIPQFPNAGAVFDENETALHI